MLNWQQSKELLFLDSKLSKETDLYDILLLTDIFDQQLQFVLGFTYITYVIASEYI